DDIHNNTAAHIVAMSTKPENKQMLTDLLKRNDIDLTIKNKYRQTPYDLAIGFAEQATKDSKDEDKDPAIRDAASKAAAIYKDYAERIKERQEPQKTPVPRRKPMRRQFTAMNDMEHPLERIIADAAAAAQGLVTGESPALKSGDTMASVI